MESKEDFSEIETKIEELRERISLNSDGSESETVEEDKLAFLFLTEELKRRKILKFNQLPLSQLKEIVELVYSLPSNLKLFESVQKINLAECLNLPHTFHLLDKKEISIESNLRKLSPYLTGSGYDALSDTSTHEANVVDLGYLTYPSVIAFALPTQIIPRRIGRIFNICRVLRSTHHYASVRHSHLSLPLLSSIKYKWRAAPKCGYNVAHKESYGDIAFTFVREFRQFELRLKLPKSQNLEEEEAITLPRAPLHPDFRARINELCSNSSDNSYEFIEASWVSFFKTYGTHVVKSSCGGGRIIVTILESQLKHYFNVSDLSRIEKEVERTLSDFLDFEPKEGRGSGDELIVNSILLQGGDKKYESLDLLHYQYESGCERRKVIEKWAETLIYRPIMLDTSIELISIANLLHDFGMEKEGLMVDFATKKLFGKSFMTTNASKKESKSWGIWYNT